MDRKPYVMNPFTPHPANVNSHVRGWGEHWAHLLNCEVAGRDMDMDRAVALYMDHGVNYTPGTLNLFGGVTDLVANRLHSLVSSSAPLYSLDYSFEECGYIQNLKKRRGSASTSALLTSSLIDDLEAKFQAAKTLTMPGQRCTRAVIGDSHSTAFAAVDSAVMRTNGLTLFGALSRNHFETELKQFLANTRGDLEIVFCAGSIDIRHHLGRQVSPEMEVQNLVKRYVDEVRRLQDEYLLNAKIAAPVPVEFESRRIPKTGWYKGAPFSGSLQQRDSWTRAFIDHIPDDLLLLPPKEWYEIDPVLYAEKYMELGSSVHISPAHYRRVSKQWSS